jgi:uncharacterized lipoprotein YmbA
MQAICRTLLLASFLVAGCASTPVARHYTLSAEAKASHRIAMDPRKIEIVAVRIPETWDRPQIVLTQSPGEVSLSEFHRWAAPLRTEIPRIVAQDLARILDASTLWLRRDFAGVQPDLRVQIAIEQIDAVPGEALRLQAAWLIRAARGADDGKVQSGRTSVSIPLSEESHAAVVAATSHALLALSIDLARDIRALPL